MRVSTVQREMNQATQGDVAKHGEIIKDNIINSKRSMTSLNYNNNKPGNEEWRLASQYARITPEQGLLPCTPQLEHVTSPRAAAALAAVQLLAPYHFRCSSEPH